MLDNADVTFTVGVTFGAVTVTVTDACCQLLLYVAVTVTFVEVVTVPAVAVQDAVVCPAATVHEAGTESEVGLFELSETLAPPVGAALPSVTVRPTEPPLATVDELAASEVIVGSQAGIT
jgi:hypothetical protein